MTVHRLDGDRKVTYNQETMMKGGAMTRCLVFLAALLFCGSLSAQDFFDWAVRTDRDGKPAGHYEETPFPITEDTESYTIRNDENPSGKTYELGTKHFVDGGFSGAGDGSWASPWTTIAEAVASVPEGNHTIIVRGAHDGFDGYYMGRGDLSLKSGVDDTHRWTLTGYGQERPVIGCWGGTSSVITAGGSVSYATVQRLNIRDCNGNCVRTGPDDAAVNVIDLLLHNNCRWDPDVVNPDGSTGATHADGNLYFLGSDRCWIFHTTSENGDGHGFKVGDDADDNLVEWSVAREAGYWDGYPVTDRSHSGQGHPTACDFPNDGVDSDGDTVPDYGDNLVIRYNICGISLFPAVQLRRTPNFSFHHNEVYGSPHFGEVYIDDRNAGIEQVIIHGDRTWGSFYANVIRDPGSGKTTPLYPSEGGVNAVLISGTPDAEGPILLYNNLVYGHDDAASLRVGYSEEGYADIHVYNNSIYSRFDVTGWDQAVFSVSPTFWNFDSELRFINNILYSDASADCTAWHDHEADMIHENNVYFHPSGGLGFDSANLGAGEMEADPLWVALPSGSYAPAAAALAEASPAVDSGADLGALFTSALNAAARPQGAAWDMGAYEYTVGGLEDDLPEEAGPDAPVEPADGEDMETPAETFPDAQADADAAADDGEEGAGDGGGEGCGCTLSR
jgi:hypothetical protein